MRKSRSKLANFETIAATMVPPPGLEPGRREALDFESNVSTNSTKEASRDFLMNGLWQVKRAMRKYLQSSLFSVEQRHKINMEIPSRRRVTT